MPDNNASNRIWETRPNTDEEIDGGVACIQFWIIVYFCVGFFFLLAFIIILLFEERSVVHWARLQTNIKIQDDCRLLLLAAPVQFSMRVNGAFSLNRINYPFCTSHNWIFRFQNFSDVRNRAKKHEVCHTDAQLTAHTHPITCWLCQIENWKIYALACRRFSHAFCEQKHTQNWMWWVGSAVVAILWLWMLFFFLLRFAESKIRETCIQWPNEK